MDRHSTVLLTSIGEAEDTALLMSQIKASAEIEFLAQRFRDAVRAFNEDAEELLKRGLKIDVHLQRGNVFPVGSAEPIHQTLHLLATIR
ncbi:hypothetical protein [Roseomonas elaeocarpi]|uniref:Uncharacterized protein n=1 Tax=Roseomonas elaeocarpi TaxID=907779 RepID=A0ABV6JP95_9PROT